MAFDLPKLDYDYAALEPHIDARTMEIHHTKHHQGYVTNLNNAVSGSEWENKSLEEILASISKLPTAIRSSECSAWARLANSLASVDLPAPASPVMKQGCPLPASERSSTSRKRRSSVSRATNVGSAKCAPF